MATATKTTRRTHRKPRTREVPMTMTANGWVPTHIVQRELVAESLRMRKDEHPDRPHV